MTRDMTMPRTYDCQGERPVDALELAREARDLLNRLAAEGKIAMHQAGYRVPEVTQLAIRRPVTRTVTDWEEVP